MPTVDIPYKFEPRDYQLPFLRAMDGGLRRAVKVWHRRAGKDKTDLNYQIKSACNKRGYYPYFFPTTSMGKRILWQGMDKTGFKFLDHFPPEIIEKKNESEMYIVLKNGSIWQIIGTDKIENVGVNPIGCVFSEFSLQNPNAWELIRPILAENGGWSIFNFTPRGRNHAYDLLKMANNNEHWFSEVRGVDNTNAISLEAIQDERDSGMSSDMVQQEFYCSFDLGIEGSYYGKYMSDAQLENRICALPYDSSTEVMTAWDLGIGDYTCIWFFQIAGGEIHLIDYEQDSGKGLAHYNQVLQDRISNYGYVYKAHFAPHDIMARSKQTGITAQDFAAQMGLKFSALPMSPIDHGIEAARSILPRCYFDEVKCKDGIKCLEFYQKKLDERNNIYSSRPLHNWASHGADAFRYLAMAIRRGVNVSTMSSDRIKELETDNARPY